MMEIQHLVRVEFSRFDDTYIVKDEDKIRAIFLSKEDAQRFIRNETIRREAEMPLVADTYYKVGMAGGYFHCPSEVAVPDAAYWFGDGLRELPEPDAILEK